MKFSLCVIVYFIHTIVWADNTNTIGLSWDYQENTNNITFKVYISPKPGAFTNATQVISSGTNQTIRVTRPNPGVPNWYVVSANDTNGLESDPSNEIAWVEPKVLLSAVPGFMRFEFTRVKANSNLQYTIQFCTDLTKNEWTDEAPVLPTITQLEGELELYQIDIPTDLVPQLFARVKVTIK